jgi:hypothetical protein
MRQGDEGKRRERRDFVMNEFGKVSIQKDNHYSHLLNLSRTR